VSLLEHCVAVASRPIAAVCAIALFVSLASSCSSDQRTEDARLTGNVTTPSTTAAASAYVLPGGGFTVASIPSGFAPFGKPQPRLRGPIPAQTLDRQSFVNLASNERLNVSVIRGLPAAQVLDRPQYSESSRRVHGCVTRIRDVALTGERQVGWVVGPTTVAFVTGAHVTDDEMFPLQTESSSCRSHAQCADRRSQYHARAGNLCARGRCGGMLRL